MLTPCLRPFRAHTIRRLAPQVDVLEDRVLLSTIDWSGDGVHWFDANNWTGHVIPGAADTAVITQTGITINYSYPISRHGRGCK